MPAKIKLFLLLWAFILNACASVEVYRRPTVASDRLVTVTHRIALWGFWEVSDPIDVEKACGPDWSLVKTQWNSTDIIIGALTLGIYTPATATIRCAN